MVRLEELCQRLAAVQGGCCRCPITTALPGTVRIHLCLLDRPESVSGFVLT